MGVRRLGIVMNGVTGRMGTNQHLIRSIVAIRAEGGVRLANGERVMPDPILVGRSEEKLDALAKAHGLARTTTNLDAALADKNDTVFFDAATTQMRPALLSKAIANGKHIYCEKPVATNLEEALGIVRKAKAAGIKHGVVQDKLFLPGLRKLKMLIDSGFFGRILAVRGEFGYWVFEGDLQPAQRPSWNYRAEDGGGMILDMLCHWRYVLDNTFGNVKSVSCLGATHISERVDEAGKRYKATADDAAYATFQLDGNVIAHFNCSWATRVRRDDLLTLQVDGTKGSAVAGLHRCHVQSAAQTPAIAHFSVMKDIAADYRSEWVDAPALPAYRNPYRVGWEQFLRHVAEDAPLASDFAAGIRDVAFAEACHRSMAARTWIAFPPPGKVP
jgi:predicted dehydrogenase